MSQEGQGTSSSPGYLALGDTVGRINFVSVGSSGPVGYASILGRADENQSAGSGGTGMAFRTTPIGNTMHVERMRITANGNVGIGTGNPSHKLHVVGSAGLSTGTAWTNTSDERLKDVHGPYERGLNEILQLDPVYFNYKKDNPLDLPSNRQIVGFVAQDVHSHIPEAVTEGSGGYLELNVDPIHWAVVNAVKELFAKLKEMAEDITSLLDSNEKQDRNMAQFQATLKTLTERTAAAELRAVAAEQKLQKVITLLCLQDIPTGEPNSGICSDSISPQNSE